MFSCNKKTVSFYQDDYIKIENINCTESDSPKGIDSAVKTLNCDGIKLYYDYGMYSNSGPKSLYESFKSSFRSYHHRSFFQKIHMDEKLYRLFIDSVNIISVFKKDDNEKAMFTCNNCTHIAKLQFKGSDFLFPYQASVDAIQSDSLHSYYHDKIGEYNRKIFISKNSDEGGLYLYHIKDKQRKKLSVIGEAKDKSKLLRILQNISIK
jgi:hypothetical protein